VVQFHPIHEIPEWDCLDGALKPSYGTRSSSGDRLKAFRKRKVFSLAPNLPLNWVWCRTEAQCTFFSPFFEVLSRMWRNRGFRCRLCLTLRITLIDKRNPCPLFFFFCFLSQGQSKDSEILGPRHSQWLGAVPKRLGLWLYFLREVGDGRC